MNEQSNDFGIGYAVGRDTNNGYGNNGFGFGGDWFWAIILLALLGNGGWGFGGGNGAVGSNYVLATDFATIERKLDGVNNGLCDGFYAQNTNMLNGFANVQQTLCQGFNGVNSTINTNFANLNNALCTLGYQNQAGVNQISNLIQSCCCDTRAAIADVKYANERNTCDIIRAGQDNTRAILDFLTTEKIAGLQAENAGLKAQISNDKQSAYLLSELKTCPIPAYVVPNPNCCYNACGVNVQQLAYYNYYCEKDQLSYKGRVKPTLSFIKRRKKYVTFRN